MFVLKLSFTSAILFSIIFLKFLEFLFSVKDRILSFNSENLSFELLLMFILILSVLLSSSNLFDKFDILFLLESIFEYFKYINIFN